MVDKERDFIAELEYCVERLKHVLKYERNKLSQEGISHAEGKLEGYQGALKLAKEIFWK